MRAYFSPLCLAILALFISTAAAQPIVFLVRHAEKLDASSDTVLSAAGAARAERLAAMLAPAGIRAIYTTQYRRSVLTAAPTAARLGIAASVLPANDPGALLAKLRTHDKHESVLVVGHSNTVPAILKGLGYAAELVIAEETFDHFFMIVPQTAGIPVVVQLSY